MLFALVGFLAGLVVVMNYDHTRRNKAIESELRVHVWREKTLMSQEARRDYATAA